MEVVSAMFHISRFSLRVFFVSALLIAMPGYLCAMEQNNNQNNKNFVYEGDQPREYYSLPKGLIKNVVGLLQVGNAWYLHYGDNSLKIASDQDVKKILSNWGAVKKEEKDTGVIQKLLHEIDIKQIAWMAPFMMKDKKLQLLSFATVLIASCVYAIVTKDAENTVVEEKEKNENAKEEE